MDLCNMEVFLDFDSYFDSYSDYKHINKISILFIIFTVIVESTFIEPIIFAYCRKLFNYFLV